MYYCVDMYNDKLNFLPEISEEECRNVLRAADISNRIVSYYGLGQCVCEALDQLLLWSNDDIVNIGLHFFLKNVRPYAASCSEA